MPEMRSRCDFSSRHPVTRRMEAFFLGLGFVSRTETGRMPAANRSEAGKKMGECAKNLEAHASASLCASPMTVLAGLRPSGRTGSGWPFLHQQEHMKVMAPLFRHEPSTSSN